MLLFPTCVENGVPFSSKHAANAANNQKNNKATSKAAAAADAAPATAVSSVNYWVGLIPTKQKSFYKIDTKHGQWFDCIRDPSNMSLLHCVESNQCDILRYWIEKENYGASDQYNGRTLLHYACEVGNLETVQLLAQNGASSIVNQIGTELDGNTVPLNIAISYGKLDIAKYLIEKCGAELNKNFNLKQESPIRVAVSKGFIKFTSYLLDEKRGGWIDCTKSSVFEKFCFFFVCVLLAFCTFVKLK